MFTVVYYNLVQPYYKANYLEPVMEVVSDNINNFFSVS